ncbi:TetR/AcrR family transcriptional regulator [Pseudonocardia sp. GCM10023141]|uniref:TetR/AcrR family transcriptional regulator n=1 Tax=Pseudonocardia sp. GCM10023141 TaxID=3252653 RepID=UPI0036103AB4
MTTTGTVRDEDRERRGRGRPQGHGPGFEDRRREIVDLATALFAEQGYSGTSVSDLMRVTGLGKGALYHYIESKENLLVEISSQVMTPLIARMREIVALEESPLVRLRMISEAILDGIAQRPEHVWVYEHDYRYLSGENRTRFLQQRHDFEGLVFQLGNEAIARGLFRGSDVRLLMFQFFSLHKQTAQWFHRDGPWAPSELSREYCRTLFNGFAADAASLDALENRIETLRRPTAS